MPVYSNAEMADMHFFYGKANGNNRAACRMYQEAFPNRQIPLPKSFAALHRRLRQNGTFTPNRMDCGRPRSTRNPEAEERVLDLVAVSPEISTRKIALRENVPKSSVQEILQEQLLKPYHLQRVQALKPQDFQPRAQFCEWMQMKCRQNGEFLQKILFTDEAGFTRDGIVNFHNNHVWAEENPHAYFESRHQNKFFVNVWAGILGNNLIGPVVIPRRLNGAAYLNFLQNVLPTLFDDVPYGIRFQHWFMHDGAPPHFSIDVRTHLNNTYQERWIGRGGPTSWPPRSPDLNPLDYFFWGWLKQLVYSVPIESEAHLVQRIMEQCEVIRNTPGIFERVRRSMRNRLVSCINMNGGQFQHLL